MGANWALWAETWGAAGVIETSLPSAPMTQGQKVAARAALAERAVVNQVNTIAAALDEGAIRVVRLKAEMARRAADTGVK